ncbi:unnamed protein product [Cyprideis torosa]|uniref:Hypoxia up-regulated protein 1 n=1 Tax=Cyprideis torosa TaxID=163714 RepID=A0A7R8ZMA1_9CRUS|nr:unnamed protein product [Cyprideis torosa]CAG0888377.1 unnamed protein product [Cyprideis torosa]
MRIGLAVLTMLSFMLDVVTPAAVMSVDLGGEWMKVGVVSPGKPMEIVLNKESKRKTPVAISFRKGERLFGDDALAVHSKNPKVSYIFFPELLGKTLDNPVVKRFQSRFPYYNLVADADTGLVSFKFDEETTYSPEELVAMMLQFARKDAEAFTGQKPIKDVVVTVPAFANQAERRAMERAVNLSGLKLLQLINDNTAAALNYGVFRKKEFNTSQTILFYDMGSTSAVATIVSYQMVRIKERTYAETHPQLQLLGVGFDRGLGGSEITIRLRDYLAEAFSKSRNLNVRDDERALGKLLKEAGRVKVVLSANAEHAAQVEGLMADEDFKHVMTRTELESLCEDLFDRVPGPIERALKASGLTMGEIDQVILIGAGTRVPKVQEVLSNYLGKELGRSLNTDEAFALGAAYKAAELGTGFKVMKFITKDAVVYPIQVNFTRTLAGDEFAGSSESSGTKVVKRVLFQSMTPTPMKKIMTFNKHTDDFDFSVGMADMPHVTDDDIAALGSLRLMSAQVKGVKDAFDAMEDRQESKGIKVHFAIEESGVLSIKGAEFLLEIPGTNETVESEPKKGEDESTFAKFGSTISKLFSGDDAEEKKEDGEKTEGSDGDRSAPDTEPKKSNATKADDNDKPSNKTIVVKKSLTVDVTYTDVPEPSAEMMEKAKQKLKALDGADKKRHDLESSRNSLESFVLEVQEKLYEDDFEKCSTEEEREKLRAACSEISDWLYEDGWTADVPEFKKRLRELKSATADLYDRVHELRERPTVIAALKDMLNQSQHFLGRAREMEEGLFTEVELNKLEETINATQAWSDKIQAEQEATPLTEKPKLTVHLAGEKVTALDREIKYLVNKAKINAAKKAQEEAVRKAEEAKKKAEEAAKHNVTLSGNETETASVEETAPAEETETKGNETETEPGSDSVAPAPDVEASEAPSTTEESTRAPKETPEEGEDTMGENNVDFAGKESHTEL